MESYIYHNLWFIKLCLICWEERPCIVVKYLKWSPFCFWKSHTQTQKKQEHFWCKTVYAKSQLAVSFCSHIKLSNITNGNGNTSEVLIKATQLESWNVLSYSEVFYRKSRKATLQYVVSCRKRDHEIRKINVVFRACTVYSTYAHTRIVY